MLSYDVVLQMLAVCHRQYGIAVSVHYVYFGYCSISMLLNGFKVLFGGVSVSFVCGVAFYEGTVNLAYERLDKCRGELI